MAIDTEDKRRSALSIVLFSIGVYPVADGSVVAADRQHVGWSYRGILSGAPLAMTFNIGIVPVKAAADPNAAGVVKVFFTSAGIGIVPVATIAEFEAGVVPIKSELGAGTGIVNVAETAP